MDYLDPIKKRSHRIRLYIGYGLLTVAVAMATVILVYVGNGYYVDRSTGDLIQNGQLFVNSAPDGATIYLNGREQRTKTAGRLVVPSGSYNVTIKREGYRDWVAENVILDGGVVERLDYARLLPVEFSPVVQQTFATSPYKITESSDRRYLTLQFSDRPLSIFVIDLAQPESAATEVTLPKTLFSDQAKIGQLQIMEWSSDNKHFLMKNEFSGKAVDYVVASRETTFAPVNVTRDLNLANMDISLRDRVYDEYYVYDGAAKTLSTITLNDKALTQKLSEVIDYRTYSDDTILYVTATGAETGKVQARLKSGDKSYLMRELTASDTYLLAIGKLGSAPVMAVGVASENKVTVLRDPLTYLRTNPKQSIPLATTVLQVSSPSEVSFSTDLTAVMARGGQAFATHSFDDDRSVKFTLDLPISATALQWVDGKHLTAVSAANAYMFDYNGENIQKLLPSIDGLGAYFDSNYQSVYTFTTGQNGKLFNVNRSLLRPKN